MPRSVVTTLEQRLSAAEEDPGPTYWCKVRQRSGEGQAAQGSQGKVRRRRSQRRRKRRSVGQARGASGCSKRGPAGGRQSGKEQRKVQTAMTTQRTGLNEMLQEVMHFVNGIETVVKCPESENADARRLTRNDGKVLRDHPACCPAPAKQGGQAGQRGGRSDAHLDRRRQRDECGPARREAANQGNQGDDDLGNVALPMWLRTALLQAKQQGGGQA